MEEEGKSGKIKNIWKMTPAIRKQAEIILCMHRLSLAEPIDRMVPEHTQDRFNITSDCCLQFSTRLEGGESGWGMNNKSCWFETCIPPPEDHVSVWFLPSSVNANAL